ncbi:MAG: hypothetical protein ABIS50_11395 [Luteolibacter sp.]|uniref:hypothetical protein n=1 Tax=Luteolibacter sp. TaxID=1962973 RepID=UPI0032674173
MAQHTLTRLTFSIPTEDAREYAGLPQITRDRVSWMLEVMAAISAAGKGRTTAVCHQFAAAAEKHFNSIYQPWQRYSKTGDWRQLMDKRHTSEFWIRDESKQVTLPHDFIQHWKFLVESNDRKAKPAHARLILRWKQWRNGDLTKAIPGYDRCPGPGAGSRIPRGWNYSNLLNHMPNDVELAAARKGRTAAKKLIAGVITTRVGRYPFGEIQFDDMWHNFLVNVLGYKRAYRLLEFGCIDHFSTFIFRPGLKPRLPDMETGKMKQLNGRDFHLYLVNWLLDYGVHPDGTIFNVENGTASISKAFEAKLLMWFGGKLTVQRAGMSGTAAFGGGWKERAKGNPNAKALKEGMGNLVQNSLGHITGQTGMNRDDCPGQLTGMSNENEMLLALADAVPALRDKLQLGFLDLTEAVFAVNEAYDMINFRTEHEIEGWGECNLIIQEFCANRNTDTWIPLDDAVAGLPDHERQILGLSLRLDPTLTRPRKLSPGEVVLAHQQRLIKPPHEAVPDLLGPEYGKIREATGGRISFTYPGVGKIRFKATYQDSDGFVRRIENGTEILTHFNPWKQDHLYLSDAKTGRFLGRASRDRSVTHGDVEAIMQKHGEAERDFKDAIRETAARHGVTRLPHIKLNTAAIRTASQPTARDRSLAEAGFDASSMLDAETETEDFTATPAAFFDPADLL